MDLGKRGRRAKQIELSTGNDPRFWQYESLREALKTNVDALAVLIKADRESSSDQLPTMTGEECHS
jgi:hypothetical protein